MKTNMKTLQVTLFLAAILALALSCAPEVELSSRSWSELNAGKNATLVSISTLDMAPYIDWKNSSSSTVSITFPNQADVLRESNATIVRKMSEFLKFYSFSSGSDTSPDMLGTEFSYTFVSRIKSGSSTEVVVKLDFSYTNNLVAKVSAAKYTFAGGKKLGSAGDTQTGTEYYDQYTTLSSNSNYFRNPYKNWYISIGFQRHDTSTGAFEYASIVNSNIPADNGFRDTIMFYLEGKLNFKLQKFSGNSWQNVNGIFRYNNTNDDIELTFTPEDLQTYRVEVSGLDNLTTATEYFGVKQRIAVYIDGQPYFNRKTVATNEYTHYDNNTNRTLMTGNTNLINGARIQTTNTGNKNIVLQLKLNPIPNPGSGTSSNSYPQEMNLNDFKKNVKIFVIPNDININNMANVSSNKKDLYFLDIKKVDYSNSYGNDGYITIDLNSAYTIDDSVGKLGIIIAPGFKYTNSNIILGNYSYWQYEVDGVRYFDYYGSVNVGTGGFTPPPPPPRPTPAPPPRGRGGNAGGGGRENFFI
jgi:hypothetical protein